MFGEIKLIYKQDLLFCCFEHSDMPEELRVDAMELCVTACEKYSSNNEVL